MTQHIHHVTRAALSVNSWGRFAAMRYIANRAGCNMATARRVLTIALQCEGVK